MNTFSNNNTNTPWIVIKDTSMKSLEIYKKLKKTINVCHITRSQNRISNPLIKKTENKVISKLRHHNTKKQKIISIPNQKLFS